MATFLRIAFIISVPFVALFYRPINWWSQHRANRYYDRLKKRGVVRKWRDIESELHLRHSYLLFRRGAGNYPETWWTQLDLPRMFEKEEHINLKPLSAWSSKKFIKWFDQLLSKAPPETIFRTHLPDIEFPILHGAGVVESFEEKYPDCEITIIDALGWFPIESVPR